MKLTQLTEQKERPYICVHAKKGKHETHAVSSYDAAKNAAKHWGMKSTAGIDAHLAEGNYPEPRKMEVTQADKDNNTEAWKRFKAGDPRYEWKDMILSKAESYDDYHGDMSKEEYDKTVKGSQMEYTVWVGGTEVNDKWLNYEEAKELYDLWRAKGYDDVQLDARLKEGSFWGRDDMVAKMKKDELAAGMRKYRKQDGGSYSGTTTSDPEKWKELEADGYEWDKDYYNDIEELEAKWKAKNEGAKPDFLDLDKDGDKKEPMKKAAKDKKAVKEGLDNDDTRNIAIRCVDEMVKEGLIANDMDTDGDTEFQIQDIIHDQINKALNVSDKFESVKEAEVSVDNEGNIAGYLNTIDEYAHMLYKLGLDLEIQKLEPASKNAIEMAYRIQNAVDDIRTRELNVKPSLIRTKFESVNEDEEAIAARDEFLKVMDMKPKSSNKAIDTIKKIVADKQNMQVKFDDGKMKVDLYTASAVSQVYDAVNDANKEKIDNMLRTKEGMLRMSNFAFSKLKEGIAEGKRIDEILPALGQAAKAVGGALASKGVKGQIARGAAKGAVNGMIKDKSGKMHKADSPQGKMIANMGKKVGGAGTTPAQVAQAKKDLTKNRIKTVGTKVKNFATGALAKAADKSGFGNPLVASKQHANDMVEQAMKKAQELDK